MVDHGVVASGTTYGRSFPPHWCCSHLPLVAATNWNASLSHAIPLWLSALEEADHGQDPMKPSDKINFFLLNYAIQLLCPVLGKLINRESWRIGIWGLHIPIESRGLWNRFSREVSRSFEMYSWETIGYCRLSLRSVSVWNSEE